MMASAPMYSANSAPTTSVGSSHLPQAPIPTHQYHHSTSTSNLPGTLNHSPYYTHHPQHSGYMASTMGPVPATTRTTSHNISPPYVPLARSDNMSSPQYSQPLHKSQPQTLHQSAHPRPHSPVANFANAGPPGYQWKAGPVFGGMHAYGNGNGAGAQGGMYSPATTVGGGEGPSPFQTPASQSYFQQHHRHQRPSQLQPPPHVQQLPTPPAQPISYPQSQPRSSLSSQTWSPVNRGRRI